MKKFDFDKKHVQIAILAFIVIGCCIIIEKTFGNIGSLFLWISSGIHFATNLFTPFIIGFCIAFVLNPTIRFFEESSLKNLAFAKNKKNFRIVSILITYILTILFIYVVISAILPSVINSLTPIVTTMPETISNVKNNVASYNTDKNNFLIIITNAINEISGNNFSAEQLVSNIMEPINNFSKQIPDILGAVFKGTLNVASILFSAVLGFIISIYYLADKEFFADQIKKFIYTFTKKRFANAVIRIGQLTRITLEKFIIGKAIDSFIIGMLFFFICVAFKIENASLFAIIIGITNMIPYFGPFIGAVPVLLILCLYDFSHVIPVAISILVLQQFDGNILGPKILGDSIGLRPISVVLSIIIGGGLFGVAGMFLGAPIYAVISTIIGELVNKEYDKKGV